MIDTIKLSLNAGTYRLIDRTYFSHVESKGFKKYIRNPSKNELASGRYLPTLTVIQRPTHSGKVESLSIEFSAPKLTYGNNFEELCDYQLESVVDALQDALSYMHVDTTPDTLLHAKVISWHPSKNIVFSDYFGCSTVINALRGVDTSKSYDIKKVDFIDGEALHIHCNSKDIAFYDKLADLSRGKISDKKSIEKQNRIQSELVSTLIERRISILRYEIRLSSTRSIKQAISKYTDKPPSLTTLFSSKLSQLILKDEWQIATRYLDLLALDQNDPLTFFEKYISDHPDSTPRSSLAAAMSIYIVSTAGVGAFRKSIDKCFGAHTWPRIKLLIEISNDYRHSYIKHVDWTLDSFKPIRLSTLMTDIAI